MVGGGGGRGGGCCYSSFFCSREGRESTGVDIRAVIYIGDYLGRHSIFHQVDDVGIDEEESSGTWTVS